MQEHHHLPPGDGAGAGAVLPYLAPRRALLVSADAETLSSQDAILRKQGCNDVTALTDPAAAMAELRGGHRFDVVLVHMCAPLFAPAFELLECAIGEMHVAAYAISNKRVIYGPLELKDLNNIRKHIYKEASSGTKSPEATPNGPGNSSPMATTPTAATLLTPGRRETRRRIRRTRVSDTISQELELDRGNVKNEQEKPPEKSKKDRLVWTEELHRKFVEAHDKLSPGDAVPKKILELMDDSTLTRENIASHLQKHRMNLDPLRSGNPKTKHQKLTPPQASLSSPNMSEQQVSPTMMQPLPTSNFSETQGVVYMNHNMSAQTTNTPPTISGMQDDHPVMHMHSFNGSINYVQTESVFSDVPSEEMYSRDNKSKENSTWCPDLSYDRGLQENTDDIVNKDPGGSWEDPYL